MDYTTFHKHCHEVKAVFSKASVEASHNTNMILDISFTSSIKNLNVPWTLMENYKTYREKYKISIENPGLGNKFLELTPEMNHTRQTDQLE